MEGYMKEVYYDEFCHDCKHRAKKGTEEPCNSCLEVPATPDSHKPVRYEKRGNK